MARKRQPDRPAVAGPCAQIELMKNNQVVLLSPREKMPFEVTPLMPYLVRYSKPAKGRGETVRNADTEAVEATVQQDPQPLAQRKGAER